MQVGERVVCIMTANSGLGHSIKKGQIYSICDVWICPCCKTLKIDVGICNNSKYNGGCDLCKTDAHNTCVVWCDADLFAPIQYNSAHDELINKLKESKEEKLDAPIKEPEVANE